MHKRRGFTLTELMIVVVIIAVLAALLLPALSGAIVRTREAATLTEINGLAQALEAFRASHDTYPPSRVVLSENGDYSPDHFRSTLPPAEAALAIALTPRTLAIMRMMFPKVRLSTGGPTIGPRLPGGFYDFDGDGTLDLRPAIISGDECLVLFLGGPVVRVDGRPAIDGLAKDPSNPFQVYGDAERNRPSFDFDPTRLIDLDGDGYFSYADYMGGKSDPVPLAYFVAYGNEYDPDDVNLPEDTGIPAPLCGFRSSVAVGGVRAMPSRPDVIASPAPNPYTSVAPVSTNFRTAWWRSPRYQLISPGRDRLYGIGGEFAPDLDMTIPFDSARNTLTTGMSLDQGVRVVERDNLTNFAGARLNP